MCVCVAAYGTGSVVFIDDVTAGKILRCLGPNYLLSYATKLKWIMTQNMQKQQESLSRQIKGIFFNGEVSHLTS